jgi:hypothetical protein
VINFGSVRYLVSLSRSGDLRQSANHLFLRAMRRRSQPRVKGLPKFGGAAGRAAPHQRGRSRLANATTDSMRLSALRPPLDRGGRERKKRTRDADMRHGNERCCAARAAEWAVDIVKKDDGRAGRTQPGLCNCARTHSCLDAVRCRLSRSAHVSDSTPSARKCRRIRSTCSTKRDDPQVIKKRYSAFFGTPRLGVSVT